MLMHYWSKKISVEKDSAVKTLLKSYKKWRMKFLGIMAIDIRDGKEVENRTSSSQVQNLVTKTMSMLYSILISKAATAINFCPKTSTSTNRLSLPPSNALNRFGKTGGKKKNTILLTLKECLLV